MNRLKDTRSISLFGYRFNFVQKRSNSPLFKRPSRPLYVGGDSETLNKKYAGLRMTYERIAEKKITEFCFSDLQIAEIEIEMRERFEFHLENLLDSDYQGTNPIIFAAIELAESEIEQECMEDFKKRVTRFLRVLPSKDRLFFEYIDDCIKKLSDAFISNYRNYYTLMGKEESLIKYCFAKGLLDFHGNKLNKKQQ